ncbi:MAG: hypothetical protein H7070_03570 [Saprospiraceae bacterium]|nr:hypothetical protein [Pyrinomonadaceae bacterium]
MNDEKNYRFSLVGHPLYPHIKLTRERFPRLLATRIIDNDDAEYFGAFLTRSAARILIDFLNRTFRLRSCFVEIDGNFPVPCTQYYAKRCAGPCVKSLCDEGDYLKIVELARLFLANERDRFTARLSGQIDDAAMILNFENAAFLRDIGARVDEFWHDKKRRVWLDDAVDTLVIERSDGSEGIKVYLVTQRGRRMLGMRVFAWPLPENARATQALGDVISQFYKFHAPREIRVSEDFPGRIDLSRELSRRFGRTVKIVIVNVNAQQITTARAVTRTKLEADLIAIKPQLSVDQISGSLKKIFGLSGSPRRIEAFDVAHISGTDLVSARSVWEDGRFRSEEYEFWFSDKKSELETLQEFVKRRFSNKENLPDLVVIDGGVPQLKAALRGITGVRSFSVIAAVKPSGRHADISHFLTELGVPIGFDPAVEAMRILQVLRDEAHDLANAVHRQSRDMVYFYELAGILPSLDEGERQSLFVKFGSIKRILDLNEKDFAGSLGKGKARKAFENLNTYIAGRSPNVRPLVVPVRLIDPNGAGGDLRPIDSFK